MVFSLYCPAEMIFCVFYFVLFFNHCISVFVLLCFIFCALLVILPLLLVIMGGQHDGLLLSGSPPYLSHLYIYMYIFHGKLTLMLLVLASFFSMLWRDNIATILCCKAMQVAVLAT